jgi:hypothetical protein
MKLLKALLRPDLDEPERVTLIRVVILSALTSAVLTVLLEWLLPLPK